jgi:Glycosyl hydrolase family 79 C-terminal beta domain
VIRRRIVAGLTLALVVAAIVVVVVIVTAPSKSTGRLQVAVSVTAQKAAAPAQTMPAGFVGLSLEYTAVEPYLGTNPKALNPTFVGLLQALAPGASPVVRIGGDSTDHTWWPTAGLDPPGGVSNNLTSTWLGVVHAFATSTHTRLVLGVNLAANDRTLAQDEAQALVSGIGRQHIEALEIGNEPDLYAAVPWYRAPDGKVSDARGPGWDLAKYVSQFSSWRQVMPPGVAIAGPAFGKAVWLGKLPTFLNDEPGLGLVTDHRYPLRTCRGGSAIRYAPYPTIPRLLDDNSSSALAAAIAPVAAAARSRGLPFRLDELNSASCEGRKGVSNTFASSLWILNTLFDLAAVGVDGVNIHTLPGAPYAPFSFTHRDGKWRAKVNPLYYGMLAFTQAFPAGAHLLRVTAPGGPVKAFATEARNGTVRMVLIDKSETRGATVTVALPRSAPVTVERLTAPSVSSTTGIELGGRSFGASTTTGVLPPPLTTRLSSDGGSVRVTLRAGSAMILTG